MVACAWRTAILSYLLGFASIAAGQQEPLRVSAAVGSQQVYVGQQFLLQIQVQGADSLDPVDIAPLEREFTVSEAGGGPSNSTSVSIVNGQMTRQVRRGYNLQYRLAGRRPGIAEIPSLAVSAGGRTASTQPVSVRILPPEENEDFKLRLSLSGTRAYIGQPVTLTVEWFIGREVQEFSFSVPLLDDERFDVADLEPRRSASRSNSNDVIEFALGDRRAVASQGVAQLDGRQYTVLRFRKSVVPRTAERIVLPAATVTFSTPQPGRSRRRDPFDDFFGGGLFSDVLGRRSMQTLAIPSNRPSLDVLELPVAGRPSGFNGWIGNFELEAEASPVTAKVGEPVTLTLTARGTTMPANAQIPPLDGQPAVARDFSVPREIGAGERRGTGRVFTQTLRARHDGVTEIPAVELPYFDPQRGEYRIARTDPIPIVVEPSRMVTADDAEHRGALEPRQVEVESSEQGIAHNYVDESALQPTSAGWASLLSPLGAPVVAAVILWLPPIAYALLLASRHGGRVRGALARRSRSPRALWRRELRGVDTDSLDGSAVAERILLALREYLGRRLASSASAAAAWTYLDVEARIRATAERRRGGDEAADAQLLASVRSVFERCEVGSYAGVDSMDLDWRRQLVADAAAVVDQLEGSRR